MAINRNPLTVATVFYGGVDVLRKTLPTWLQSCQIHGISLSFIDNTEGSEVKNLLSNLGFFDYPKTYYRKSNLNIGFAEGANQAVRNAPTSRVMLLNPDTYLDSGIAKLILTEHPSEREPFVAFRLDTAGVVHAGISLNKFGFFVDSTETSDQIIGPSGGAMLFDKETFLRLGGFANQLFAWGEDAEFALRLTSMGIRTRLAPIVIRHVGGHTVATAKGATTKAKLLNRNRILILRASYSLPAQVLWLPLLLVAMIANMVIRAERRKTIFAAFQGVITGLTETPNFAWDTAHRLTLMSVIKLSWFRNHE